MKNKLYFPWMGVLIIGLVVPSVGCQSGRLALPKFPAPKLAFWKKDTDRIASQPDSRLTPPSEQMTPDGSTGGANNRMANRSNNNELPGSSYPAREPYKMPEIYEDPSMKDDVVEGAKVTSASRDGDQVTLEIEGQEAVTGDVILAAVGRRANIDKLNLEAAGIETNRAGVVVDKGLRTSNRKVYAIGDVAGGLQFTHVAGYQAGLVIRSALFRMPVTNRTDHIPWATFTDPEMAHVGLTEADAREKHGDKLEVLRFDYAENDRARAELKTKGLIKVMVVKGKPVGVSIVGAAAGEQISLWALAISKGLKIGDMAGFVAPYPTMSELSKRVAGAYYTPRLFQNDRLKWIVSLLARLG